MNNYSFVIANILIPFLAIGMRVKGDFVSLVYLVFLIIFSSKKNISGKQSLLAGLLLVGICSILIAVDEKLAQELAIWAFLSILSGAVSLFIYDMNFKAKMQSKR